MNYYRVGDLMPSLTLNVEDSGLAIDVTSLNVYVRWQRPDLTEIAERTARKVDAANGVCAFDWEDGDLGVAGLYQAIVQIAPASNPSHRQSLEVPPTLAVEVLPNDFGARDEQLDLMVPIPTVPEVALLLGQQPSEVDSAAMTAAIDRARRLTYIQCHLFLIGSSSLSVLQVNMLRDLVIQLAALLITQPPSATYGPYQRETMASYSYELRKLDTELDLYGVASIDAIIKYFREHVQSLANPSVWVAYPEWWQPVTERLVDPSRLGTLDL